MFFFLRLRQLKRLRQYNYLIICYLYHAVPTVPTVPHTLQLSPRENFAFFIGCFCPPIWWPMYIYYIYNKKRDETVETTHLNILILLGFEVSQLSSKKLGQGWDTCTKRLKR